jgi:hypothetical protein
MQKLTFDEIAMVSGAGRATGSGNSGLSESCADGAFWGTVGGAIAGAAGGIFGAALGAFGGFFGGAGAGGCFHAKLK